MHLCKIFLLFLITLVIAGIYYFHAPMPQNPAYHQFADQRTLLHIPNFWLVISNVPFLLVGILGIQQLWQNHALVFRSTSEKTAYWIFFIGALTISIGSSYYHLAPDNSTLIYDRLPMTFAFMGILSAIMNERIGPYCEGLLWPLVLLGVGSVVYWHYTDDLRLYLFVQFFPILCLPLLLLIFPAPYTQSKYVWLTLIFYGLAKIFEKADKFIYHFLGNQVSGHMLKHLFAALSMYFVLVYLQKRTYA